MTLVYGVGAEHVQHKLRGRQRPGERDAPPGHQDLLPVAHHPPGASLGPYSKKMPRALWRPSGVGLFLISEALL